MKMKIRRLLYLCPALLLAACSDDTATTASHGQGKTPIELSVGVAGQGGNTLHGATRSVVTTGVNKPTPIAFDAGTNLYMVMKCENGGTTTYTRTMGTTAATETNRNDVNFTGSLVRYWEDAHSPNSRNSHLSVYAACVPGKSTPVGLGTYSGDYGNTWGPVAPSTTIAWPLNNSSVANQTKANDFVASHDLCFSNNVSDFAGNNPADNRIHFDAGTNKFTSGNMIFYHALTKVTFRIVKGEGYEEAPFTFTNANENIVLAGFNTGGTFDLTTGEFSSVTTNTISELADTKAANDATNVYVLTALMLPGTDLNGSDKDALDKITFTIDHNHYYLKKSQLKTALDGKKVYTGQAYEAPALETTETTDYRMRPGVHYIFTLTVGKKKIDKLTATLVDWEDVTAENATPSNARFNLSVLDASGVTGSTVKTGAADFDLYRSAALSGVIADNGFENYSWATGYVDNKATLSWDGTNNHYTTTWYWPNNKTFYHFRAVSPLNHTVATNTTPDPNEDYITLTAASGYTDVCWGAPFLHTTGKLGYSITTGFDNASGATHQIYKAIGATEDVIRMVMFHMMSDVTIQLTTTGSADAVDLTGAVLQLTNIATTGTVRMGDGLVTAGETALLANQIVDGSYKWHYGFVPQDLTNVELTITTTDHNQYKVNMKDVVASTYDNNLIANPYTATNNKIGRWYPNFRYTYTFTLKKTGVEKITATLADWEDVLAGDDNVKIK